jgi:hypothetical protein
MGVVCTANVGSKETYAGCTGREQLPAIRTAARFVLAALLDEYCVVEYSNVKPAIMLAHAGMTGLHVWAPAGCRMPDGMHLSLGAMAFWLYLLIFFVRLFKIRNLVQWPCGCTCSVSVYVQVIRFAFLHVVLHGVVLRLLFLLVS